jgi:uncharacterized membrane protein YphA (DoxX/SURF4 family)
VIPGILLCLGLWTPAAGILIALDEAWIALFLCRPQTPEVWTHVFRTVLSVSIAMLGPGAFSVDARLFGRKRFDIDRTRGRKPSL